MPQDSLATSNSPQLAFLDLSGKAISAPKEWEPALVQVIGDVADWQELIIERHGQQLRPYVQVLAGEARILVQWPRSGPGNYRLLTRRPDRTDPLDFSIRPTKISEAGYQNLIVDLESALPAAVALAMQSAGGLAGLTLLPPSSSTRAQELQRLRRAVRGDGTRAGLDKILVGIAEDPHSVLRPSEPWTPTERARRPIPSRLAQATSRGHNLSETGLPLTVVDRHVELTYDVYENRLVHSFHNAVARRLARLIRVLSLESQPTTAAGIEQGGSPRTTLQDALDLQLALSRARARARFLDEVGELSQAPDRPTMVLLNRPVYRSALEAHHAFLRSVWVRLVDGGLEAPLENLPHLYEVWGTLKIATALLGSAAERGFKVVGPQQLIGRDADGLYVRVLPDGQPIVNLMHPGSGTTVRLIPQRTFSAASPILRSMSFAQVPDVTVEIRPAGSIPRLLIFDPKYKLDSFRGEELDGRPKKDDIDKMHAYRDAIRGPDGQIVVEYAAILYPGPLMTYRARPDGVPQIEALPADPADSAQLTAKLRAIFDDALLVESASGNTLSGELGGT
jgi:hypothetical protein